MSDAGMARTLFVFFLSKGIESSGGEITSGSTVIP